MCDWTERPKQIVVPDASNKQLWWTEIWIGPCCISRTRHEQKPDTGSTPVVVFPENRWRLCSNGEIEVEAGNNTTCIDVLSFGAVSARAWTHGSGRMSRVITRDSRTAISRFLYQPTSAPLVVEYEPLRGGGSGTHDEYKGPPATKKQQHYHVYRPYYRKKTTFSARKSWGLEPPLFP